MLIEGSEPADRRAGAEPDWTWHPSLGSDGEPLPRRAAISGPIGAYQLAPTSAPPGASVITLAILAGTPALVGMAAALVVLCALVATGYGDVAIHGAAFTLGGALGQAVELTLSTADAGREVARFSFQAVPLGLLFATALVYGSGRRSGQIARERRWVIPGALVGLAITLVAVMFSYALSGEGSSGQLTVAAVSRPRLWPAFLVGAGAWPIAHVVATRRGVRVGLLALLSICSVVVVAASALMATGLLPGIPSARSSPAVAALVIPSVLVAPQAFVGTVAWALGTPLAVDVTGDLLGQWSRFSLSDAASAAPLLWMLPLLLVATAVVWGSLQPVALRPAPLVHRVGRFTVGIAALLVVVGSFGEIRLRLSAPNAAIGPEIGGISVAAAPWSLAAPVLILAAAVGIGMVVSAARAGMWWTSLDALGRLGRGMDYGPALDAARVTLSEWIRPPGSGLEAELRPHSRERRGDHSDTRWAGPKAGSWRCGSCGYRRRTAFCPDCGRRRT